MTISSRAAAAAAIIGGVLWGLTPLRQPVFGAGRTPGEGVTFFRFYNVTLVVVAALLTVALLHLRGATVGRSRTFAGGWWTMVAGHALIAAGSLPAVVFGDQAESLVSGGQDVGFLGAMIAGLGALALGVDGLRRSSSPRPAAALYAATLPIGITGTALLGAAGAGEDYLGLPITLLYGGAFVALGLATRGHARLGRAPA